jgi:hypothetical protein
MERLETFVTGGCLGVKGSASRVDWALFAYMNRSTHEQDSRPKGFVSRDIQQSNNWA